MNDLIEDLSLEKSLEALLKSENRIEEK